MNTIFHYSDQISDKVVSYLTTENFLTEIELTELREKSASQKITPFRIMLKDNPGITEKSAKLVAHLTDKPYFALQDNIPVVKDNIFDLENGEANGAFLIKDADGEKILCLDPLQEGLQKMQEDSKRKDVPVVVMSHLGYDRIKKNFDELVKKTNAEGNGSKSQISIVDAEDNEAANSNAFVYKMLKECIEEDASDVHIDLELDDQGQVGFKLRYRVDGFCHDVSFSNDIMLYRGIVNKLKLDAGLKIDERRLPQDGRISFELNGKLYNFRLSFMPNTVRNAQEEKIVLRQMADVKKCDLYGLDILPYDLAMLEDAIQFPHGFVCVTGPTGSGKTTLLYALLQQIDRTSKNLITLEDPIEAEIPQVNQSQIFHRIGYDFARGLRVILRQDPDIVMVGEMRDEETASKAFEAANTGHLVFSTLHTNTAASSITRLLQMNVPYYFISSALKFVVAQRLVRRIAQDTARPHPDTDQVLKEIAETFENASEPVRALYEEAKKDAKILDIKEGTPGTGYKGRMAIMEVMKINDDIRHVVSFDNGNEDKIQEAAEKNGMLTIQQYGYLQVLKGLTTFEEINNAVLSQ